MGLGLGNGKPLTPLIGREYELHRLVSLQRAPMLHRAFIFGEPGMGKTRLMEEVIRRVGRQRSRYFAIPELPAGEGIDLLSELPRLSSEVTLLILDDIDDVRLAHASATREVLRKRPELAVYVTSSKTFIHSSWDTGLGRDMRYLSLRGLDYSEAREVLAAVGVIGDAVRRIVGELDCNPGKLLAWAGFADATALDADVVQLATILGPDGKPFEPDAQQLRRIELSVQDASRQLIEALMHRPQLMYELSPRRFEEAVADLYAIAGFEVELTRASKDGGVDFYALQKTPFGSFLTIVDTKRYRVDRPIQVGLVRSLYGVTMSKRANAGVIATTSYFTAGAKTFQEEHEHQIGLQDFISLKDMLEDAAREAANAKADTAETE